MQKSNRKRVTKSSIVMVSVALQAIACGTALTHPVPAAAEGEDKSTSYGLSGSLGVGALNTRTYEGSAKSRTVVGPDISLNYRTKDWGHVELGNRGLVWHAFKVGDVNLGPAVGIDPGRKTKESSTGDPTPGDKRLAGMGDVRSSTEAGVLLGYGPFSLLARRSVGDRGHRGTQVDFNAKFPMALTDKVGVRFEVGTSWADRRYMQTYFGVTPEQAQASGYRTYTPKSGVRKFEASIGAEYGFAKNWKLNGAVVLSRLTGDAAVSPLVAIKSSTTVSASIAYVF